MPAPLGDSLDDHGSWAAEVDELKLASFGAEDVAVRSLERGAGDDQSLPCFSSLADPRGERAQPRGAVFIGEWNPGRHSLDVPGRVEIIAFDEIDAECARERRANDAFPGTSDPHNNVEGAGTLRQWI
jgi:hypothetical protein